MYYRSDRGSVRTDNSMMKKKDLILIGVVLLAALISYGTIQFMQKDGKEVVVTVDGKETFRSSIDQDQTYEILSKEGKNVIRIQNGKVSMTQADCPDKICKAHKAIHKSGETIVCLPHKVVVEVEAGEAENELDGITR